jgi:hypothetical protein
MRSLTTAFISILLSGCLITEWEDVSKEEKYRDVIGSIHTTKVIIFLHGVTMEPNYEKILDHYTLMKAPGFGGPEVLSKHKLPIGTKIEIVKVQRCIDCLKKSEEVEIQLPKNNNFKDAPIRLTYKRYISGDYFE